MIIQISNIHTQAKHQQLFQQYRVNTGLGKKHDVFNQMHKYGRVKKSLPNTLELAPVNASLLLPHLF